jgi:hypothetical protein
MPFTITRPQRDAIYQLVLNHLSGIDAVWTSLDQGDVSTASRLGREFAQELRLLDNLGWSTTIEAETVELTLPAPELTGTFARLHKDAAASIDAYVSRAKDEERLAQRDLAAAEALGDALGRLASATVSDDAS